MTRSGKGLQRSLPFLRMVASGARVKRIQYRAQMASKSVAGLGEEEQGVLQPRGTLRPPRNAEQVERDLR